MFHPEMKQWLDDFSKHCEECGPTDLANFLIMMGCTIIGLCDCKVEATSESDKRFAAIDACMHNNHIKYNTAVWLRLFKSGKLMKVRRVIMEDCKHVEKRYEDGSEFGKIVLHSYGRELLAHFLKNKPDDTWVNVKFIEAVMKYET